MATYPNKFINRIRPQQAAAVRAIDEAMICGYIFTPEGHRVLEDLDTAVAWLGGEKGEQDFLWLHLNLSHAHIKVWLNEHLDLPEAFYEALNEKNLSTRIERDEDALIATINDILFDFTFDASDIATLWSVIQPNLIITAREKPLRSADRLRVAVKNGELLTSPVEMLVHLLYDQAEELTKIVAEISDKTNSIEDRVLANRLSNSRNQLGNMRRLLVRFGRLLAPEPNSLFRLLTKPPAWINEDDIQDLRQATEEFVSIIQDMTVLNERIKILQEQIIAYTNEQTNRSLYLLTIVTVLALPFNIVAGLFGMNVGGIPLAESTTGFWSIVIGLMLFLVLAVYLFYRNSRN